MKDFFSDLYENIELERELGTRTVELDRALLVFPKPLPPLPEKTSPMSPAAAGAPTPSPPPPSSPSAPTAAAPVTMGAGTPERAVAEDGAVDVAIWTGRPLSAEGTVLCDQMIAAMKAKHAGLKVCVNREMSARVIVLMGSAALKARAPGVKATCGSWMAVGGVPAVVTYSPDYLLTHFAPDSDAMREAKKAVWTALKGALARLT